MGQDTNASLCCAATRNKKGMVWTTHWAANVNTNAYAYALHCFGLLFLHHNRPHPSALTRQSTAVCPIL